MFCFGLLFFLFMLIWPPLVICHNFYVVHPNEDLIFMAFGKLRMVKKRPGLYWHPFAIFMASERPDAVGPRR